MIFRVITQIKVAVERALLGVPFLGRLIKRRLKMKRDAKTLLKMQQDKQNLQDEFYTINQQEPVLISQLSAQGVPDPWTHPDFTALNDRRNRVYAKLMRAWEVAEIAETSGVDAAISWKLSN